SHVTAVQTCALPILTNPARISAHAMTFYANIKVETERAHVHVSMSARTQARRETLQEFLGSHAGFCPVVTRNAIERRDDARLEAGTRIANARSPGAHAGSGNAPLIQRWQARDARVVDTTIRIVENDGAHFRRHCTSRIVAQHGAVRSAHDEMSCVTLRKQRVGIHEN